MLHIQGWLISVATGQLQCGRQNCVALAWGSCFGSCLCHVDNRDDSWAEPLQEWMSGWPVALQSRKSRRIWGGTWGWGHLTENLKAYGNLKGKMALVLKIEFWGSFKPKWKPWLQKKILNMIYYAALIIGKGKNYYRNPWGQRKFFTKFC